MYQIEPGRTHPLGATPDAEGVNFSLYTGEATAVDLLLFAGHDDPEPAQIIPLDPRIHTTFRFWHVYVRGLRPGAYYAYRVDGPHDLVGKGHRFDREKGLLDPYARGVVTSRWNRGAACRPGDNLATSMRGVVIDLADYNWEGDQPLRRPLAEQIIYEVHVGGFTRSPSAESRYPGTFLGLIERIPYLQELGITAVELLPIFQFDPTDIYRSGPHGEQLTNYWGYNPFAFFTPHNGYCVAPEEGAHIREFRDMVKALHRAGLEVILDVVYNHTSEGNDAGPVINLKGLDNPVYYHLDPADHGRYQNYSGCGNTINCNHPIAEKLIVESLEFWVREMHVDGFRFDEGSILSRGEDGNPMVHPPLIWHIELSEVLADTIIIAEAWDAAGVYQIGYFPGYRWAEWNPFYRDEIRRFVKGDPGLVGRIASRLAGSADIYQATGHLPLNSVNFITCHDGFTLYDWVSYTHKHNEANGEANADGINDNLSGNHGVEGETDDPAINDLRRRQMKNAIAILMLSQGVPMILGGDEIARTQHGNNNAYCQDNALSWYDWARAPAHHEIFRFFQGMIAFRKAHPILHRRRFFTGELNARGLADITWHGCDLEQPGWTDPQSRVLAFTLAGFLDDPDIHVMLNMETQDLDFAIPPVAGRHWHRAADTGLPAPADLAAPGAEPPVAGDRYRVQAHSVAVLISRGLA